MDEPLLRENRRVIHALLHEIARMPLPEPVLEVGPMVMSAALERYPEYFVDSRALFRAHGKKYLSLDIDTENGADIVGDVTAIDTLVNAESVGTLVMLSVLEHVPKVWEVPRRAHTVLREGGLLIVQTPWNLRLHGPRPDCWRISDDGYRALFDDYFDFARLERTETTGRDLCPVSFTGILRKR